MDPMSDRWHEIDSIYDAALERPPEARADFVAEACRGDDELRGAVEALLESAEGAERFLGELHQRLAGVWEQLGDTGTPTDPLEGTRLGPYRLVRRVERGGMGTVYLAVRADQQYEQQVAVKVLRQGLDTEDIVARFVAERKILATLDHPNIARLLDGGATDDGRPYFVMEFVEGQPIDDYWAKPCNTPTVT
jgi:serine/threonine-protein kinase